MTTRGTTKEIQGLIDEARGMGLVVTQTKKGRYKVATPRGVTVAIFPSTPGDRRSWLNCRSDIRRARVLLQT